jgi:FkbM family methyltransferase
VNFTDANDRWRSWYLANAPVGLIRATAKALARGKPLALEPGWRFDIGAEDTRQIAQWRRALWSYYRDHRLDEPVIFRWYDALRMRLFLGNDLSLCLYAGGSFEPNEFSFLRAVLEPGMVFFDGGANDGLYSLYAARRVTASGVVVAAEPSTREFDRLQANIALNSATNVRALKVALGAQPGSATLAIAEEGHEGQNTIGTEVSNPTVRTAHHETVALQTIDGIVDEQGLDRLDFVKLDVEGSEVEALNGATVAISRFQPIMLLEAEDERLASQNRTKADFTATVRGFDYEMWVFDADTAQLRKARATDEPEGNVVAAPRGWQPPALT